MSDLLHRTLHPWKFTGETLHENVEFWDGGWKSDWEEYAATLFCSYDIHDALCDDLAEYCLRRKHAGDADYYNFNLEAFQRLSETIQKAEDSSEFRHFQEVQDVIQSLTYAERELFKKSVMKHLSEQIKDSSIVQGLL